MTNITAEEKRRESIETENKILEDISNRIIHFLNNKDNDYSNYGDYKYDYALDYVFHSEQMVVNVNRRKYLSDRNRFIKLYDIIKKKLYPLGYNIYREREVYEFGCDAKIIISWEKENWLQKLIRRWYTRE